MASPIAIRPFGPIDAMWPKPFLRVVLESALAWVVVGVPVAVAIAASRIFIFVLPALPEMVVTAALLGLIHGVWLWVGGPLPDGPPRRWLGLLSGALLGSLGFGPVFSRVNELVIDRVTAAVFFGAAIAGGLAAGFVTARAVTRPTGQAPSSLGRLIVVGFTILLPLASLEYVVFWPAVADRLPVRRVSERTITAIRPGDGHGSSWSGCYDYMGTFSRGSGGAGGAGGILEVTQTDGVLTVHVDGARFLGTVEANGRFRFGGKRVSGADTLWELWEGRFHGQSFDFAKRLTVWHGQIVGNSTQMTGAATRRPCG